MGLLRKTYTKMNKEVEAELKAKLKQLPMPEKIKCSALYKHLLEVYAAQKECDLKNRKIVFDFTTESKPMLKQMADIAMGKVELTDELLEGKEEFFTEEELKLGSHLNTEKLDSYYITVLKKCPMIAEKIKPADEPILKHLTWVEPVVYSDKDDYALKFHFSENEFFTNETLEVVVVMNEEGEATEIKSDTVNWNADKNVTEKTTTKKQKNKRTGQTRNVTKSVKVDCFFSVFQSLKDEGSEENDDDEDGEETGGEFQTNEELIGVIKDNVVPYSGPAFFGVKIPELEFDGEDFEDMEGEDDEDFSDEEPESAGKKKKASKKSGAKKSGDAKEQECKQN